MNVINLRHTVNSNAKAGEMYIFGQIGGFDFENFEEVNTSKKMVEAFKELEKKYDRINIRINSPGGLINEGLPIINAIKASPKDVHTYIEGVAYSMGFQIFQAAKKGNRHAAKNSLGLAHAALGIAIGNASEMRDEADWLDKVNESLIADLVGKSNLNEKEIKERFFTGSDDSDNLMTAKEMLELGFVDVIEEYEADAPANVENMSPMDIAAYYAGNHKIDKTAAKEQSFMQRITDHVINAIHGNQPETKYRTMSNYKSINLTLGVESLKVDKENNVIITADQAKAIDDKLAELDAKGEEEESQKETNAEEVIAMQERMEKIAKDFEDFKASVETGAGQQSSPPAGKQKEPGDERPLSVEEQVAADDAAIRAKIIGK